jgi:CheY-like chemotaxis protein
MQNKTKILIIDDEEDICLFAKSILEKTNRYEVVFSTSANAGIDLAKSLRPDLILLDVRMPEKDGSAVAQILSGDEATQSIKVVFLTALAIPMAFFMALQENDNLKASAAKADKYYFIQKPVSSGELVERLDSIIREIG